MYNFRQTKQKDGESLDSYHTRLRQLAKTCEFSNIDTEIKEHIILTCSSNSLRCRTLRENLTLDALFKPGRALELSEEQARQVEKAAADVNVTETKGSDLPRRSRQRNELNTPRSHVSEDLSHAIVKSQTSETASPKTTAQKLGLITISVNTNTVTDVNKDSPESLQEEFECLCGGIGRLRNKIVSLHVDPDITPRQQPRRRILIHVRGDVEKELERLERLDIIEGVEGPTPWISPIVVVPKKSGVRICVDMPEANKAVKREKQLMPTIFDLIADLNGATHFSTLDLSSGYHQLEIAPESRFVTTFSTHV